MAPEIMSQSDNWFSFHLLSEGDTSTLGKYNSHFSHDVLSHIIGEPIPGNCYMWSAPKQPFVLPVRVRNFENLYKKHIETGEDATPFKKSAAVEIKEKSEERENQMAKELLSLLKKERISILELPEESLTGIYQGQLYYFVKKIKELPDFQDEMKSEDQLYIPLLSKIFECEIECRESEHPKKGKQNYYWIPTEKWKAKLK